MIPQRHVRNNKGDAAALASFKTPNATLRYIATLHASHCFDYAHALA